MMKTENLRSALGLMLLAILCYFMQGAVFSRLRILGAAPLLLPMLALGCGLLAGAGWGGCFGLVCGILCDASMGSDGLLFTVYLTALGFFSGFLGEYVLQRGFPAFFLLTMLGLLAAAALQMLPLLYRKTPLPPLACTALVQTLYSLLFCLPLYLGLCRALRQKRRSTR